MADKIFTDSERRIDLDKWLEKLSDAILIGINTAADSPNSKYPAAIVRMENLHAFYCMFLKILRSNLIFLIAMLFELKIPCLEARRKVIRQLYQENINIYVREMMGRPLEKIHVCLIFQ